MREFKDKVAVVTGAASGIGLACAKAFAHEGMSVALLDLRAEPLDAATREVEALGAEALPIHVDVSVAAEVEAAAERIERRFGKINLLMNNAAVFIRGPLIENVEDDVWEWLLGVNLYGVLHGVRSFLPKMRANGEAGHIVNTASISGLVVRDRRNGVYAASKSAIVAVSEALEYELQGSPIGISVVTPGPVSSDFYVTSAQHRGSLGGPNEYATTPPDTAAGMKPDEVARRIVAAVAAGQFYITTDPNTRVHVEERHRRLMSAYDFMEMWERGNT